MIKVTTSNVQEVKAQIRKALEEFGDSGFVTIGIHEDAGEHEGGITNATLGATLHYGNDRIPARPWLDVGVESEEKLYLNIIQKGVASGDTLEEVLNEVGNEAAAAAQLYMGNLKSPPNAESTIKRKGSSNPLIDDGNLRQSVTFKTQIQKPSTGLG